MNPNSVTVGADGNIWFGSFSCTIGSITTSGTIHLHGMEDGNCIITVGAATNAGVWFTNSAVSSTDSNTVGYITSSGSVTEFALPSSYEFNTDAQITVGPDGNLWFAADSYVGYVTPNGSAMNFYAAAPVGSTHSIITGPDGNLWFEGSQVGVMNTAGQVLAEYGGDGDDDGGGFYLTTGADGNIWVSAFSGNATLTRITPSGSTTKFALPASESRYTPVGVTVGPDSNIWFTTYNASGEKDAKGMGTIVP